MAPLRPPREYQPRQSTRRRQVVDFFHRGEPHLRPFADVLKKEISPVTARNVREEIEKFFEEGKLTNVCGMVNALHVVAPEECPYALFTEKTYNDLITLSDSFIRLGSVNLELVRTLGTFFSERSAGYLSSLPSQQEKWEPLKNTADEENDWTNFYMRIYSHVVIDPNDTRRLLDRETFDALKKELPREYNDARESETYHAELAIISRWRKYIEVLSHAAVLHPDWKSELPINHTLEEQAKRILTFWKTRPGRRAESDQGDWQPLIIAAEPMAILAAERAEIVAPGRVQLTSSTQMEQSHPLPSVKEY